MHSHLWRRTCRATLLRTALALTLTAAATAALTLYDMVKGVQRDVRVEDLRLLAKRGGRSGEYVAP